MKKVIIITDVNFWVEGAGHRTRILRLVGFLSSKIDLTIVYIGINQGFSEFYLQNYLNANFVYLNQTELLDKKSYGNLLKKIFQHTNFDVCIIEFIHNSSYLNYIPPNITTILDAHDIISKRTESFKQYNSSIWDYDIPKSLEYKLFDLFDYIMLICNNDIIEIQDFIQVNKLILAPHPPKIIKRDLNHKVNAIGFIGSEYTPNVDAIVYFLKYVWPYFSNSFDITLNIYGNVIHRLENAILNQPGIRLMGLINDLKFIYNNVDIIINPVRFGAGLKIKNVEAMANGIPLVTTEHGSRGLESGINTSFLLAENAEMFISLIERLIGDFKFRNHLSKNGYTFIETNFSLESCFNQLLDVINK